MASSLAVRFAAPDADVEIVDAKIVEPKFLGDKIVDGRIVDGRVVDLNDTGRRAARARNIDREELHAEIIAVFVLGLAILVVHFF